MPPPGTKQCEKYKWAKWSDLYKLKNYVVLDVETTGLSHDKEKIIEIAIVKVNDGVVVDKYASLVNPGKRISARITKLTGLADADLADAPQFSEIAQQVVDFIGNAVILAHNAPFDMAFLCNELIECGIAPAFVYIDTVQVARKAYPDLKNHKLETLIAEFSLTDVQTHRALDDALCTFKLFGMVCEQYGSPLVEAISGCCTPISDYRIQFRNAPLDGLRFALVGSFTFTYAAVKKLITVAGGKVVSMFDADADYLIYGFIDPIEVPPEHEQWLDEVKVRYQNGGKTKPINEVAFLRLCGVSFYDNTSNATEPKSDTEEN